MGKEQEGLVARAFLLRLKIKGSMVLVTPTN